MKNWKFGEVEENGNKVKAIIYKNRDYNYVRKYGYDEKNCYEGLEHNHGVTEAFTTHKDKKGSNVPSIITLCKRWLEIETNGAFKPYEGSPREYLRDAWHDLWRQKWGDQHLNSEFDIDSFHLANILLRELMQTTAALPDEIKNLPEMPSKIFTKEKFWHKIKLIHDPTNAASLAGFGYAAYKMALRPPLYPNIFGDFIPEPWLQFHVGPNLPVEETQTDADVEREVEDAQALATMIADEPTTMAAKRSLQTHKTASWSA